MTAATMPAADCGAPAGGGGRGAAAGGATAGGGAPAGGGGLFVYGSLMEGFFNREKALAGKILSQKRAFVRGTLFHQAKKGYPALVPGAGRVTGEFIEVENFGLLFAACDPVENFFGAGNKDNEYERRLTPVEFDNGEAGLAYVYWYARHDLESAANPALLLPEGDWRRYMEGAA